MSKEQERAGIFLTLGVMILSGVFTGCKGRHESMEEMNPSKAGMSNKKPLYQCSMHPQITSDKPGTCPICGMKLERVDDVSSETAAQPVKKEHRIIAYRHPMRPDITSPKPAKD